ncbi:MAG: precorrin-3B C(17)-methyltransferase, partial [Treponema sp.]|nr:precorrin-3B C(17)-methyltransferase [Treponema sp.]
MGRLIVAGIGPGSYGQMTHAVISALEACDEIIGYSVYIDLLKPYFPAKEFFSTPMRQEEKRCKIALEHASDGKNVVFVCSGDAGVYGMAGLLEEMSVEFPSVDIQVLPGITAAVSGAAILGAPLVNDFAVISLSDALTEWSVIEKRLECASQADFCIAIYNPSSHRRKDYLSKACDILLKSYPEDRPCGYVKNIGREEECSFVCTLQVVKTADRDMFSTVFSYDYCTR